MIRYFILLSAILLSATLSAQTIKGTVYNQLNKEAIRGVSIRLDGPVSVSTGTGVNGDFSFKDIQPGSYQLKVSHLGFESYQTSVKLGQKDIDLE
ncbi:MAG: carboxypeptidase regulatory-like domain-containing protein, partial [Pedobacter sp.]